MVLLIWMWSAHYACLNAALIILLPGLSGVLQRGLWPTEQQACSAAQLGHQGTLPVSLLSCITSIIYPSLTPDGKSICDQDGFRGGR